MKATIASIALIALFIAPISAFANGLHPTILLTIHSPSVIFQSKYWPTIGFANGIAAPGDTIVVTLSAPRMDDSEATSSFKVTTNASGHFYTSFTVKQCFPPVKRTPNAYGPMPLCRVSLLDLQNGATNQLAINFK